MKKAAAILFALLVVLIVAAEALGQSVGASQIKKKADGGLVADPANALTVAPYRGASAPAAPVTGQWWCDTTFSPCALKTYTGSTWEAAPSGSLLTQSTLASFPSSPTDGQIVYIKSLKRAIVYDATDGKWRYLDNLARVAGTDYSLDVAGYSSAFLTPPSAAPTVAAGTGTSTAGTHVCAVTFLNSTGGETMPGPSSSAVTTTGAQGIAVSAIQTGGAGVTGRRVYCSEAGTTTPLFLAATIDDNTTTSVNIGTATNVAFVLTAPDVDFSAPIPAGWSVMRASTASGGCGSTGSSLLCVAYLIPDASVSSVGVRLFYGFVGGSPWRAKWRVKRLDVGFFGNQGTFTACTGSSTYCGFGLAAAAGSNTDASGPLSAFGLTSSVGITVLPLSSTGSYGAGGMWREPSGSWQTNGAYTKFSPPLDSTPFTVMVAGRQVGSQDWAGGAFSANGLDWVLSPAHQQAVGSPGDYTQCDAGGRCAAAPGVFQYVGPILEKGWGAAGTQSGAIIEIDDFTWKAE